MIKELENFIFLLSQSSVLVTQSTEWAKECAQNMMELTFRKLTDKILHPLTHETETIKVPI